MPFAPRPLTTDNYIHLIRPIKPMLEEMKDIILRPIWKDFTAAFYGLESMYVPITKYPLCYENNKEMLSAIGYNSSIPSILETMGPDKDMFQPERDETGHDTNHFLQAGMVLSAKEDAFIYEVSCRQHLVGLWFCHTPDYIRGGMEKRGFNHGRWMLDQVVFIEQGKTTNIMYGQDHPNMANMVCGLLRRVSAVNQSFEDKDDPIDTTHIFTALMREFYSDNEAVLNKSSPKQHSLVAK